MTEEEPIEPDLITRLRSEIAELERRNGWLKDRNAELMAKLAEIELVPDHVNLARVALHEIRTACAALADVIPEARSRDGKR